MKKVTFSTPYILILTLHLGESAWDIHKIFIRKLQWQQFNHPPSLPSCNSQNKLTTHNFLHSSNISVLAISTTLPSKKLHRPPLLQHYLYKKLSHSKQQKPPVVPMLHYFTTSPYFIALTDPPGQSPLILALQPQLLSHRLRATACRVPTVCPHRLTNRISY